MPWFFLRSLAQYKFYLYLYCIYCRNMTSYIRMLNIKNYIISMCKVYLPHTDHLWSKIQNLWTIIYTGYISHDTNESTTAHRNQPIGTSQWLNGMCKIWNIKFQYYIINVVSTFTVIITVNWNKMQNSIPAISIYMYTRTSHLLTRCRCGNMSRLYGCGLCTSLTTTHTIRLAWWYCATLH